MEKYPRLAASGWWAVGKISGYMQWPDGQVQWLDGLVSKCDGRFQ